MTTRHDNGAQPTLWEAPDDEQAPLGSGLTRQTAASKPVALPTRRPATPMEFSELWNIDQVANYLDVPKDTIYGWRTTGYGPQGFRVGKHLRWRAATVIAWTLDLEQGR